MKIFTNGCFDILHRGHLELLKYCSELACPVGSHAGEVRQAMHGRVIVGLNSDSSARKLKGESRPINNEKDRKFALESLKYVDNVYIFDQSTPLELIKQVEPDIIVKGGDYHPDAVVGGSLCEVKIFNYLDGYSTTDILNEVFSHRR